MHMKKFPVFLRGARKRALFLKKGTFPLLEFRKGTPFFRMSRKSGHFFPLFSQLGRGFSGFFFSGNVHFSPANRATQTWPVHRNFFNPRTARGHWSLGSLKKWSIGAPLESPHLAHLATFSCFARDTPHMPLFRKYGHILLLRALFRSSGRIWDHLGAGSGVPQDPVLATPDLTPNRPRSSKSTCSALPK